MRVWNLRFSPQNDPFIGTFSFLSRFSLLSYRGKAKGWDNETGIHIHDGLIRVYTAKFE